MTELANIQTRQASCQQHGQYEARSFSILGKSMPWSRCPVCAAEREAEQKAEEERRNREAKQAALMKKIGHSGIPDRFHNRTLEAFEAETDEKKRALAFAKDYADNFDAVLSTGRCALFIGLPGTGKTHLACGIGLQIMREQNRTVYFTTVQRAMRRVKDSWSRYSRETESQAIETLVAPDLLILDEVGVQSGSDFERNTLFDVLNERYEKRRPTILISNLTPGEVKAFLGERVVDRIREDGGGTMVFKWQSYREQLCDQVMPDEMTNTTPVRRTAGGRQP